MEKLAAVNLIRRGLGVPAASALDTGTLSMSGEAETFLDEKVVSIMGERPWHNISVYELELELPDSRFTVTGGSGTFTFGETVTQQTSGATGIFKYLITEGATTYMYLVSVSGTFTTGSLTLTGGTSGATKTGASYTAVTEARHAVSSDWTRVVPAPRQSVFFTREADYLYNPDPDELTFTWDQNVFINYQKVLAWTSLTDAQQEYIARAAALDYQRYKNPSRMQDALLYQQMLRAKATALQEDIDAAPDRKNLFIGADATRFRGRIHDHTGRMIL